MTQPQLNEASIIENPHQGLTSDLPVKDEPVVSPLWEWPLLAFICLTGGKITPESSITQVGSY